MVRPQWRSPVAREVMFAARAQDPSQAMMRLADALLQEADVQQPPVNLRQVASFQNVRSIEAVMMTSAGRLIPQGDGLLIQVNDRHPLGKQHFTTGHEIGHTLIPSYSVRPQRIDDAVTGVFQQDQEEEYLCDIAAAELLMPMALFKPLAAAQGFSLETLETLRHLFRASREATALRLIQTGLWPCAMAVWHQANKPSELQGTGHPTFPGFEPADPPKKLRIRYAVCSPSFGAFLPRHLSAEPNGCLAQCFTDGGMLYRTDRLFLRKRYEEFFMMAVAVDYIERNGPAREVLSLLLPVNVPGTRPIPQPSLWAAEE